MLGKKGVTSRSLKKATRKIISHLVVEKAVTKDETLGEIWKYLEESKAKKIVIKKQEIRWCRIS